MNELGYQRLILKSVIEHGGAGWKCSNRFLIGVPDLLIQDPEMGASLWEVKKATFPKKVPSKVRFKVSKLQLTTLKQWEYAGGSGGVVVFASNKHTTYISAIPTRRLGDTIISLDTFEFLPLERGRREAIIIKEIRERI